MQRCNNCGRHEERLWQDNVTGKKLCGMCLEPIIDEVTMSPRQEGDNLDDLLDRENGKG